MDFLFHLTDGFDFYNSWVDYLMVGMASAGTSRVGMSCFNVVRLISYAGWEVDIVNRWISSMNWSIVSNISTDVCWFTNTQVSGNEVGGYLNHMEKAGVYCFNVGSSLSNAHWSIES